MKGALSFAAFSKAGVALAKKIAAREGGEIWAPPRYCGAGVRALGDLEQWTGRMFAERGAIIFISACGIAVRAVAPHLKGKERDPAVVALDESGAYVIPLLSGHLGGANALARRTAGITGGKAVITTATDINGVPAIDEWARERCCAIENLSAAKIISASALEGAEVALL